MPENKTVTILAIDDEAVVRNSIAAYLDDLGYTVLSAQDGEEGLALFRSNAVDLVLVDLRMPRMDGISVMKILGEESPETPVIVVSGTGMIDDVVEALHVGAWDYILKPISDMVTLRYAVTRSLEKAQLLRENKLYQNFLEREVRKRTEELRTINEALFEQREQLQTILDSIPAAISFKDTSLRYIRVNHALEELFDRPEKDWVGKTPREMTPTYPDLAVWADQAVLFSGRPQKGLLEYQITPKGERWMLRHRVPYRDKNGSVAGVVTISLDITERKLTEDALQESEKRFRAVIDQAADAIFLIDLEGHFVDVNRRTCETLGYTRRELLQMKVEDIERGISFEDARKRVASGSPVTLEGRQRRKDGTEFPVEVRSGFIELQGQQMVLALARDVTERARAEEERARLAKAIEQAAESILITDAEGTIEYANPAFEKMTGYVISNVIGQTPYFLESNQQGENFQEQLWEQVRNGKAWSGRILIKRQDGQLCEVDSTLSPVFDHAGRLVNCVGVSRDVSHEVELEKQLLQAQKMEAIGTLAGGIAHDFNNILFSIMGYTDLVKESLPTTSKGYEFLREIEYAAQRATDLVGQILTFSRQTERKERTLRLQPIIEEALKLLRGVLPTTIDLVQHLDADCGPVLADSSQIHQVIMNLATNAYHAMRKQGGTLTVSLRQVYLSGTAIAELPDLKAGNYACLSIEDTGVGMPKETIERIFEPYFTTKEAGEGTGLGLSTVHGIVRSCNGHIGVYSTPNKGTAFTIHLPLSKQTLEASATRVAQKNGPIETGKERILFVDDEVSITVLMKSLLERLGYTVTTYTSPDEALQDFKSNPDQFDLVITDQTMPGITGEQLAQHLLELRADLPIVIATGYSETLDEDKARTIGIRAYLTKPISTRTMAATIRQILDEVRSY